MMSSMKQQMIVKTVMIRKMYLSTLGLMMSLLIPNNHQNAFLITRLGSNLTDLQ